jgi:hypothetical protein
MRRCTIGTSPFLLEGREEGVDCRQFAFGRKRENYETKFKRFRSYI